MIGGHFPWPLSSRDWHPTLVNEALEIHQALEHWVIRLEARLSEHGVKVSKTFKTPTVPTGRFYEMGGQRYEHHDKCDHRLIEVNESVSVLVCRSCRLPVSPVWWIHRHTDKIAKAEAYGLHLACERVRLEREIDELKAERAKHKQAVNRQAKSKAAAKKLKPAP